MSDDFISPTFQEIRILPPDLSNQIAAGEVVERPASAVRELVENSLDAGATRIEVELLEGGAQLIRVTDDGRGMSAGDAERSIQRHATSKIATREDLFRIASYGFRGEALPSIASVSRFELVTRTRDTLEATRLVVEGGSLKIAEPWSAPVGTSITVKDIFYNTPARRKFLKTKNHEQRICVQAIEDLALPRPDVSYTLIANGRTVLKLPAVDDIWQRVSEVVGYENSKQLYPAAPAEQDGVTAWGFISSPSLTERNASGVHVFVNGRAIRDRSLIAAVKTGYETLIDRARSPVAFIFVTVPFDALDVNVHPAKTEVRFSNPSAVFRAVRRAVATAVAGAPWQEGRSAGLTGELPPRAVTGPAAEAVEPLAQGDLAIWSNAPRRSYTLQRDDAPHFQGGYGSVSVPSVGVPSFDAPSQAFAAPFEEARVAADGAVAASATGDELPGAGWFQSLHYIGPLHRLYLLLSGPNGLIVVDQHAAHERITYEHLRQTWRAKSVPVQPLLVPDTISLSPTRALTLLDHLDFFAKLGFELEDFGDNDFVLRSMPAWFGARDFRPMLHDALDDLALDGETTQIEAALDAVLSRMACHGSIRAGDTISRDEVQQLMRDLDTVDFGANCPHGRPVYLPIDLFELESRFERR